MLFSFLCVLSFGFLLAIPPFPVADALDESADGGCEVDGIGDITFDASDVHFAGVGVDRPAHQPTVGWRGGEVADYLDFHFVVLCSRLRRGAGFVIWEPTRC